MTIHSATVLNIPQSSGHCIIFGGHMIAIWAPGNQTTVTTVVLSHGHMIVTCHLPCWFSPSKVNGEAHREGHILPWEIVHTLPGSKAATPSPAMLVGHLCSLPHLGHSLPWSCHSCTACYLRKHPGLAAILIYE